MYHLELFTWGGKWIGKRGPHRVVAATPGMVAVQIGLWKRAFKFGEVYVDNQLKEHWNRRVAEDRCSVDRNRKENP